jgi:glycosyltransferase involved in cell wall biosynthesis
MRPLRIAMLGVKSVPTAGGIARYVEELGSRLVSRGHGVTVYCREHYLDDPATGNTHRGMQRVLSPGLKGKHLDAPTHTLTAALDSMRKDFDILHIHGLAPGFVTPFVRGMSRKRIVLTVHACDWQGSKWGGTARHCMKQAAEVALRLSHRVTVVSRGLEQLMRENGHYAVYTPPGVARPELLPPVEILEHGIAPNGYVLCVSRLMPEKGIHYAVEAFKRLKTDLQLVIAGDCPYRCEYVDRLKAEANDRVKFVGYASGRFLQELYSNAYLYLQPSDLEGLSVAVLEALSYGRCVLASNIPQNIEALGGHGYTFGARDVDDLTRQLAGLCSDPDAVRREFAHGRDHVAREYDWERSTDLFEDAYASCFSPRSSRRVAIAEHA